MFFYKRQQFPKQKKKRLIKLNVYSVGDLKEKLTTKQKIPFLWRLMKMMVAFHLFIYRCSINKNNLIVLHMEKGRKSHKGKVDAQQLQEFLQWETYLTHNNRKPALTKLKITQRNLLKIDSR